MSAVRRPEDRESAGQGTGAAVPRPAGCPLPPPVARQRPDAGPTRPHLAAERRETARGQPNRDKHIPFSSGTGEGTPGRQKVQSGVGRVSDPFRGTPRLRGANCQRRAARRSAGNPPEGGCEWGPFRETGRCQVSTAGPGRSTSRRRPPPDGPFPQPEGYNATGSRPAMPLLRRTHGGITTTAAPWPFWTGAGGGLSE